MTDERAETVGWLNGLYRWLRRTSPQSESRGGPPGVESPAPSRISHYAIRRRLGAGGMGVVYEADDERLKRTVAVKMILAVEHDETTRRRFWREARAAARVNHPHVCQIYEVGEEHGTLFIAMELLEGEPLSEHLKRGQLSVDRAVPIAVDILAALGAVHASGIVHRDLKPSNVFVARHGVKLLDFGLARPVDSAALDSITGLTRAGTLLGTPGYMAPELIEGGPLDARTDLFAVGAIVYEMLAGRPAFGGRTMTAILHATLNEEPPALAGSAAVAAVDRVIRHALAKRPDGRPASAEAMADQLKALRSADGQEQRPATDGSECPRCGRRRAVQTKSAELCAACLLDMALDVPDAPDEEGVDADESLPFEIITILAQDADAVTYLARGFVSPSFIAVKILAAPDMPAMLSRIHAWKTRLERVRHAGISRFVDAGAAGAGRVYLATEYVAGTSLGYLLRHRTLTAPDRSAIAQQVADALAAMHGQGLAHMRLNASRIKVATSGGVRATILGLGSSLIVEGQTPQPDRDIAALADVCRALGISRP